MRKFSAEIDRMLDDAGIPKNDRHLFIPEFPADTEPPLGRREAALNSAISKREGTLENPATGTIRGIRNSITQLEKKESADKARRDRIIQINKRTATIDNLSKRIQSEVTHIEGPEKERLMVVKRERLDAYAEYFNNLCLEQEMLEHLYSGVTSRLSDENATDHEQDLEFSIRWVADVDAWLERGSRLFDQRTNIPYGTMDGLADAAHKYLVPAWISGDAERVRDAMKDEFLVGFREAGPDPSRYLRTGISLGDVLDWLYEVEHVSLSYGLKYNGVELDKLSPGTKGIVLLILYIGMDQTDTRPLIVDQPDENLDNESIYELLTKYFKTAKGRRQILLITHNPNLVVNTDSEQVVIASAERRKGVPHISYCAGSLEDNDPERNGIRQQVCRILEGGSDAFLQREQRYALANELLPALNASVGDGT